MSLESRIEKLETQRRAIDGVDLIVVYDGYVSPTDEELGKAKAEYQKRFGDTGENEIYFCQLDGVISAKGVEVGRYNLRMKEVKNEH